MRQLTFILLTALIILSFFSIYFSEIITAQKNEAITKADSKIIEAFDSGSEKVKVIVELEEAPRQIFGFLNVKTSDEIREDIINELEISNKVKHKFTSFNGFSAELTREEIEMLENKKNIKKISYNYPLTIFLQNSTQIINATHTWNLQIEGLNLTGTGQSICIIDTGVDYTHADLGGCFGENNPNSSCKVLGGYDFGEGDVNPVDVHGHGTHVAGIVSANNSIKGVAPDSKLIAIKVFDDSGVGSESDIVAGIEWCANNMTIFNISVITISLGLCSGNPCEPILYSNYCDPDFSSLRNAINSAVAKNISVTIATGNEDNITSVGVPACIQNATRVGSTTKTEGISDFSNRWNLDMLVAPGNDINSTKAGGTSIAGCSDSGNYRVCSGTSMSTPHVAGTIAIIKQLLNSTGNNFNSSQIFQLLNSTGKRINDSSGNNLNYSRINVYNAVYEINGNYNDIIFNSSFESGNLINVTYISGNIFGDRHYKATINYSVADFSDKHWWYFFSIENATEKTITIEIENLSAEDFNEKRWTSRHPVYSYNSSNPENWTRLSYGNFSSGNNQTKNFSITISPSQDRVWLAPIPPYTISMRNNLFAFYSSSSYLNVTSLGITPLGQNLTIAEITDLRFSDENKYKIYVIAQQHSFESVGSYQAEGIIEFLLSENETAQALRRSYIFRIIPIVNVEGVYYGISRYTPFRNNTQYDLNRVWSYSIISNSSVPEINLTFEDTQNFMPDAFLDLHGDSENNTDAYFLHDGNLDTTMTNFLNNLSGGRNNNSDYWPETEIRRTSANANSSVRNTGIHPSVLLEAPYDNRTNTAQHPISHNPQNITDWEDWGKKLALGIYAYFQDVYWINSTSSIYSSENLTIEANILRQNIDKVWYNIKNSTGNYGSGFMTNYSLTYYNTSYNITNLSAGTYTLVVYSNDTSNDIINMTRTFSVISPQQEENNESGSSEGSSSSGGEGGGGGGGGGGASPKVELQSEKNKTENQESLNLQEKNVVSKEKISQEYSKTLKTGEKIIFEIFNRDNNKIENHELSVNEIKENYVNATLMSSPVNFVIREGEEKKFNLTSIKYYNIKVRLEKINAGESTFIIQSIYEEMNPPSKNKKPILAGITFISSILFGTFGFALLRREFRKKREQEKIFLQKRGNIIKKLNDKK